MKLTLKTTGQQADIIKILTPLKSTAMMQAVCTQVVSVAQAAFADESKRAAVWPARKKGGGTHPLLRKSGDLFRSVRVTSVEATKGSFGSDLKYAGVHQFGAAAKPHQRTTTRKVKRQFLEVIMGRVTGKRFSQVSEISKTWTHPGAKIPPRPFFPVRPGTDQLTDYAERAVAHTVKVFLKKRPE